MQINRRRLFLVSNMYPSEQNVRYGIFVKNFEKAVEFDYDIERIVITKQTRFFFKLIKYFRLYLKIVMLIYKVKKNDLIYVHFPLHMAPALCLLQFFKKKIVLNFHGSDLIFKTFLKKVLSIPLYYLVKKNFIVVPSNYYKIKIVDAYSIDPSMVFVYPSGGINMSVFYPRKIENESAFVFGFVSNFIESKGWKVLLKAIDRIIKNEIIQNVKLIMIGEGPDYQKIKDSLRQLNINHKIISSVSQEELALYYSTFNLFIFPTKMEALGLVGLEAMACGTSVIASDAGGPVSYIEHGINSYLFKKDNPFDLEQKIMQFYSLPSQQKAIVRNNGLKTARLYDHNIVNNNLLSFLNGL